MFLSIVSISFLCENTFWNSSGLTIPFEKQKQNPRYLKEVCLSSLFSPPQDSNSNGNATVEEVFSPLLPLHLEENEVVTTDVTLNPHFADGIRPKDWREFRILTPDESQIRACQIGFHLTNLKEA